MHLSFFHLRPSHFLLGRQESVLLPRFPHTPIADTGITIDTDYPGLSCLVAIHNTENPSIRYSLQKGSAFPDTQIQVFHTYAEPEYSMPEYQDGLLSFLFALPEK